MPRAKKAPAAPQGGGDAVVWKGPEALRPLLVPIDRLHEDIANTNTHDDENIRRLAAGFAKFGCQKPIVAGRDGVIAAGNGSLRAMRSLGWTHAAVVPSDLEGLALAEYSVSDNQLASLSKRDEERLLAAIEYFQQEDDFDPEAIGFSDAEIAALIDKAAEGGDGEEKAEPKNFASAEKWMVVVECRDEAHQVELLERFQAEGLDANPIVS